MKRIEEMTLDDAALHKLAIANERAQQISADNIVYQHSQECTCLNNWFGEPDEENMSRPFRDSVCGWKYFQKCPLISSELKGLQLQIECWERYCELQKQTQGQFPTSPDSEALIPSDLYSEIAYEELLKSCAERTEEYRRLGETGHYKQD